MTLSSESESLPLLLPLPSPESALGGDAILKCAAFATCSLIGNTGMVGRRIAPDDVLGAVVVAS